MTKQTVSSDDQIAYMGSAPYVSLRPAETPTLAKEIIDRELDIKRWEEIRRLTSNSIRFVDRGLDSETQVEKKKEFTVTEAFKEELRNRINALEQDQLKRRTKQAAISQAAKVIQPQEPTVDPEIEKSYLVFRVRGRRFAIPVQAVATLGRVNAAYRMNGRVKSSRGEFPLYDMKALMNMTGEGGDFFVGLSFKGKRAAWAVDGIEGIQKIEKESIRLLEQYETGAGRSHFLGVHRSFGGFGSQAGVPLLIFRPDVLFRRPPRV